MILIFEKFYSILFAADIYNNSWTIKMNKFIKSKKKLGLKNKNLLYVFTNNFVKNIMI